ncbi:MAG TPA: dicarboxylate/amino acid:cation symporter [Bacillota bacterium]|nr:dicarboxylate/amino acid:cation symporter [Bacillota bacterium]HPW40071.1 dicarboxylate/amino acid:cation symporter [Bacillota bacterium]
MSTRTQTVWEAYRFPIILFTAIIIGSIIGITMGANAAVFKPLGDIFLNLMFTVVVPLVFITISSAVANMANMRRLGSILKNLLLVFVVTGIISAIIMIFFVTVIPPAQGVNLNVNAEEPVEKISLANQAVKAITVSDFPELLSRRNMLPLIVFSVLFGFCVTALGEKGKKVAEALDTLSNVMMKMVSFIMYYAPIGLAAYFAALVGEFGPELLKDYARAMAIYYPVTIAYFFIAFFVYAYYSGGMPAVKRFFKNIVSPAFTSLATQSSIATLPVNLESARKMGVPKDIREIVLPMGATMHMDGSCLSAILKISFLFGLYGKGFTGIGTFATAILISVMSGVVMSGVPGGGLIGEMLIVNLYGFPPEAFPIIATIGFLVDPPATMVNACGDSVAAMMVTRLVEGKEWLAKVIKGEAQGQITE